MERFPKINETLLKNAEELGAQIVSREDDRIEALIPSELSQLDSVKAADFLVRAVPNALTIWCEPEESENEHEENPLGIRLIIQQA